MVSSFQALRQTKAWRGSNPRHLELMQIPTAFAIHRATNAPNLRRDDQTNYSLNAADDEDHLCHQDNYFEFQVNFYRISALKFQCNASKDSFYKRCD
ncbi:hypothetical protein PoB_002585100 [Plakobranchus ocellatus]|uniref:Uncharacterized protein n=1 Tax=Plakobranchus ocellatus TaxID=259542 RepID=A0AAV3ZTR3_9GAST|nr:hypothetical protein PoB_002585100 [Plakobranchus ocellatus]